MKPIILTNITHLFESDNTIDEVISELQRLKVEYSSHKIIKINSLKYRHSWPNTDQIILTIDDKD